MTIKFIQISDNPECFINISNIATILKAYETDTFFIVFKYIDRDSAIEVSYHSKKARDKDWEILREKLKVERI